MSKVNNEIAVQERKDFGKGASRRSRKAGIIPAIVYSKGGEAKAISVDVDAWKVLSGHHVQMVTLVNGSKKSNALVKEVQYNRLKNYVQHIDFLEVDMKAEITAMVPVHAQGDSIGVNRGGVLDIDLHELEVICKANLLPEAIVVDITALNVGDVVHVKDLVLPKGVQATLEPEHIVLSITRPKVEEAAAEDTAAAPEAAKEKKAESK